MAFGALLHKGRLDDQDVILKRLTLDDWRVVKTMGSAVAVGAIGVNYLAKKGLIKKDIKPLNVGGVVAGAALFGAGMSLFGYCPGTSVAAVGAGRKDALAGFLGMLFGAAVFVAAYPKVKPLIEAGGALGKKTLPDLFGSKEKPIRADGVEKARNLASA
jgi:uncharacterized membrane protein YedE/YeeE